MIAALLALSLTSSASIDMPGAPSPRFRFEPAQSSASSPSATLDVPYLSQTDALCGGAAAAMVFRYWGDAHAMPQQFAPLIDARAGGIADGVLVSAIRQGGWQADAFNGSLDDLRSRLVRGQPTIVLLADRGALFHYVVVVGMTAGDVLIHDPAWGPSRPLAYERFLRLWQPSNFWSLAIRPPASGPPARAADAAPAALSSRPPDACDALLDDAVAEIRRAGTDAADRILGGVRERCPQSAGPLRELAGVRFAGKEWLEAARLARQALALRPDDAYAADVLGASLFMLDDPVGALRAWNAAGKPRLDLVRIEGLRRSRYQAIAEALDLQPGKILTADNFARARRRLDELPDRVTARLSVRPEADGFASVDIVMLERSGLPASRAGAAAFALRGAIDRAVGVTLPGTTGQGEAWSIDWRWWNNRPRVAFAFAAPRAFAGIGVWRVDASWEAETYAASSAPLARDTHRHAGLTVSDWIGGSLRYSFGAGFDAWKSEGVSVAAPSFAASLEHRMLGDRVAIGGDLSMWISGTSFARAGARVAFNSSPEDDRPPQPWTVVSIAGVERTTANAPRSLWGGGGEGLARPALLRAHPLLDDGAIRLADVFGKTFGHATVELQRWMDGPPLVRVGLAAFVDAAAATSRAQPGASGQVDAGAGFRLRLAGTRQIVRIDWAHGLRDGADALTVGWIF